MFSLPQPEDVATPEVEGCPVVILSGDRASDWHKILKHVIYDAFRTHSSLHTPVSMTFLGDVFRIADKYDCPHVQREMRDRMTMTFPTKLSRFLSSEYTHGLDFVEETSNWGVVNLAIELGALACLPALYASTVMRWPQKHLSRFIIEGILNPKQGHDYLQPEAQKALIFGRDNLYKLISDNQFRFIRKEERLVLTFKCAIKKTCGEARDGIRRSVWNTVPDIKIAMSPLGADLIAIGLCSACKEAACKVFEQGQEKCWDGLPGAFGLPAWAELTREDRVD